MGPGKVWLAANELDCKDLVVDTLLSRHKLVRCPNSHDMQRQYHAARTYEVGHRLPNNRNLLGISLTLPHYYRTLVTCLADATAAAFTCEPWN